MLRIIAKETRNRILTKLLIMTVALLCLSFAPTPNEYTAHAESEDIQLHEHSTTTIETECYYDSDVNEYIKPDYSTPYELWFVEDSDKDNIDEAEVHSASYAVSADNSIVEVADCREDYLYVGEETEEIPNDESSYIPATVVSYFVKSAGETFITYTSSSGKTKTVAITVRETHPARMYIWIKNPEPNTTGDDYYKEEIQVESATFSEYDEEEPEICVHVDGKYQGGVKGIFEIKEGEPEILNLGPIIVDEDGIISHAFYISPKERLDFQGNDRLSTVLVATDLDGKIHEFPVIVYKEFVESREKAEFERSINLYLEYIAPAEMLAGERRCELFVPFAQFNTDWPNYSFTREDVHNLKLTMNVGGEQYTARPVPDAYTNGNYHATFKLKTAPAWGAKYTINCELYGIKRTIRGTVKKWFNNVTLNATNLTYNGKVRKPSVTVKQGKTTLKKDRDYDIQWGKTIKNVGTYKVEAYAPKDSKYSFWIEKSFRVNPKGTTLKKLTKGKKSFTVTWNKQATQTTGYQIQYGLKKNFKGAKTYTVKKNNTLKATIKKLKAKKTYYVRIRTYKTIGKTKYYSGWSKAKTIKTK